MNGRMRLLKDLIHPHVISSIENAMLAGDMAELSRALEALGKSIEHWLSMHIYTVPRGIRVIRVWAAPDPGSPGTLVVTFYLADDGHGAVVPLVRRRAALRSVRRPGRGRPGIIEIVRIMARSSLAVLSKAPDPREWAEAVSSLMIEAGSHPPFWSPVSGALDRARPLALDVLYAALVHAAAASARRPLAVPTRWPGFEITAGGGEVRLLVDGGVQVPVLRRQGEGWVPVYGDPGELERFFRELRDRLGQEVGPLRVYTDLGGGR